ncbi:hypothetical protein CONCODRAFT_70862 [Conidiobolus coronatus NRRL 28638]|uniref:Transcription factor domain-containing protein n=1 Tax=Conidiobolus coronatus (strain ATCC 28846 / CBS 209.66 / NRRL 28638) TaxID=796925 RepID=A0A137P5E4_CONC2|nr:hypothetical protein CONCODRAFT_70862 [Conidiobolus coronatus NRRL 28638]|eukprot:KXN70223.1 hypothetical protein CONCODRAFT_70862 [Conidiobolus coronatus NRRL 28638]
MNSIFMESKNHKFKSYQFDNNNKKSGKYFKVDFYTLNESEFISITSRLEKFEDAVSKLISYRDNNSENEGDNDTKKDENNNKSLINLSHPKIFDYKDPVKQLTNFYFIYQYYFSSPSLLSVKEYYESMSRFNNKLPDYLTYAILSRASLNSPIRQLYTKNLEYCEYYYDQSVTHLYMSMSKNEIDIYMLYALIILMWIDESMNRQFFKCSRIVTCIKLAQILGLDNIDLKVDYNKFGLPQSSLKKLLLFIRYYNNEASKIFNLPKVLMWKELEYDYSSMRLEEEMNDKHFIDFSTNILPKEYSSTYKSYEYYSGLGFTDIVELERELYSKDANSNFKDCFYLIQNIARRYYSLPCNIRYSKDFLNSEEISKDPLVKMKLLVYQLVLKQISRVYGILIKIVHKLSIRQVSFLAQKIVNFNEKVLSLLKDQQFAILNSSKNLVNLKSPTFYYFGKLLLDLIEKLKQEAIYRKSSELKSLEGIVITEYNSFSTLIENIQNEWDGSPEILKSLSERYNVIQTN